MFRGAILPTAPYAVRGAVYYQGEYNGGDPRGLDCVLPLVIASWRTAWNRDDLPFLFVQLPGFIEHRGKRDKKLDMAPETLAEQRKLGRADGWAPVRDVMRRIWRRVPHTGMAVAIDSGEPWDIHPRFKKPVAQRLYLQALKVAYDQDVVASGPVCEEAVEADGALAVRFSSVGSGLDLRGDGASSFELAGADRVFHPAVARVVGDRIELRSDRVTTPRFVRYAWAAYPEATLYNREGLPASPFELAVR
jgi:sialate O-acetylesterase